jgi:large subunit ribosomal protein L15
VKLSNLNSVKNLKKAKRVGRGESSGKGKTASKGNKGQKSRGRGKIRIGFEGGQLPLIKRLPFRRGVGNSLSKSILTLTLTKLNIFEDGETVDQASLLKKGLLKKTFKPDQIKIVGTGELKKSLTVSVDTTNSAKKAIEKAKGSVVSKNKEEKNA